MKGKNVTLWCFAPKQEQSSDSDDALLPQKKKCKKLSALEEKNKRVESMIWKSWEKHGTGYTNIQYTPGGNVDVGTHK